MMEFDVTQGKQGELTGWVSWVAKSWFSGITFFNSQTCTDISLSKILFLHTNGACDVTLCVSMLLKLDFALVVQHLSKSTKLAQLAKLSEISGH